MKKSTLMLLALGSALLLQTPVSADSGQGPGKFMRFFDANQDGTVTLEEFNAAAKARFQRMDQNQDGKLTEEEFEAYIDAKREERKLRRLQQMDSDQDGKVTEDEYVAYQSNKARHKFARMDTNGDGVLGADEYKGCKGRKHFSGKRIFHSLDENGDGVVTEAESYQAWSSWFNRIDANGDKVVSTEEVNAYRAQGHKHP